MITSLSGPHLSSTIHVFASCYTVDNLTKWPHTSPVLFMYLHLFPHRLLHLRTSGTGWRRRLYRTFELTSGTMVSLRSVSEDLWVTALEELWDMLHSDNLGSDQVSESTRDTDKRSNTMQKSHYPPGSHHASHL